MKINGMKPGDIVFHVFNDGEWERYSEWEEAKKAGLAAIESFRKECDPEWPGGAEEVEIYLADFDCEHPDREGRLVASAVEVEIGEDDCRHPGYEPQGCEYWSDYELQLDHDGPVKQHEVAS